MEEITNAKVERQIKEMTEKLSTTKWVMACPVGENLTAKKLSRFIRRSYFKYRSDASMKKISTYLLAYNFHQGVRPLLLLKKTRDFVKATGETSKVKAVYFSLHEDEDKEGAFILENLILLKYNKRFSKNIEDLIRSIISEDTERAREVQKMYR